MPVPDETYFGEKPEGGGISYGEVRKIQDESGKLLILKKRLDPLLVGQIDELARSDERGNRLVYSPFPLMVLTLLSVETLGYVICDVEKIKSESEHEQSKTIVTPVYKLIDSSLSNKPTKDFYTAFEKIHGTSDKKSIKRYSDVIHKYQRNTFNHGYQSRGVFITEDPDLKTAFEISAQAGCLYINPYLFWELFKKVYNKVFKDILDNKNQEWRVNALKYFHKLIN